MMRSCVYRFVKTYTSVAGDAKHFGVPDFCHSRLRGNEG